MPMTTVAQELTNTVVDELVTQREVGRGNVGELAYIGLTPRSDC